MVSVVLVVAGAVVSFIFFGGLELLHAIFYPNQEDSGTHTDSRFDEDGNIIREDD